MRVLAKSVAIGLLPDRLDVVLQRGGRIVETRRVRVELPRDPESWIEAIVALSSELRAIVTDWGAEDAPTRVFHRSPSSSIDLVSTVAKTQAIACEAAVAACSDALPYPASSAVCAASVIGRDRKGAARRTHTIVAADRDDVAVAIGEMVGAAGLSHVGTTPVHAAVLAQIARRAIRATEPRAWLHIAASGSYFVIGGGQRIEFGRAIGFEFGSMVSSLCRPIHVKDAAPVELTADEATRLLFEHGIPEAETTLDPERGLMGHDVRPLIQPALQRCMVELRQSIRFGVEESMRDRMTLTLTGPGSPLPGLAELMASELGLEVDRDDAYAEFEPSSPGGAGSTLAAAIEKSELHSQINLLPQIVQTSQRLVKLRRAMWVGVAAGVGMVVFDYMRFDGRLSTAEADEIAVEEETRALEALQDAQQQVATTLGAMQRLDDVIESEVGSRPAFAPLLLELSRIVPEDIKLSKLLVSCTDGGVGLDLTCLVFEDTASEPVHTMIASFVDALGASPLIDSARLVNVQAGGLGDRNAQRFDVRLSPIALPARLFADAPPVADGGPS